MSNVLSPIDPKDLRPLLHQKVDALSDAELAAVHGLMLEVERHSLFAQMAEEAESDRLAGKLDPALVEQAVREHRQRQPYR
jgi:hypothetical protein